jgi:hypothetical protein
MATRFWVGGTGTWDASDTTHWAATTNGAGGASVPSSADTVTFDASSGGGTVTVNTTVNVQSITMGAFTSGTLDFSINNNNVSLSASTAFSGTGTVTRTLKLGNGTFSLTGAGSAWDMTTTTGLTFDAGNSTISWTNTASGNTRTFITGGLTYWSASTVQSSPLKGTVLQFTGAGTFNGTVTIAGGSNVLFPNALTTTISNLVMSGISSAPAVLLSASVTAAATVAVTTATIDWSAIRWITFTGGPAATNSFDLGSNSGITITAPSGGGGSTGLPASRVYLGVK